jgi:basic amino acid/polyamine antiporter, APA family
MGQHSRQENLRREIGPVGLSLAIVNITVGTGIFVIPAIIAENLGAAAIIAYLVCGLLISFIALCFAELGSKTKASGGIYTYIENAFGPFAGFIANNLFVFIACVSSDAAVANALADTLKYYFPFLDHDLPRTLFFVIIFGGLGLLNIRSVKHGMRFIEIATFGKLIPLVLFVMVGTAHISMENLHWSIQPTITRVGSASLLLFFAFLGVETAVTNGGEFKNPRRTVPLGILMGMTCVLVLYISIQLVTQGILGATLSEHKDAPLADIAGIIAGKAGITVIILVSAVAMLGSLGGEIIAVPRILYAGARDGIMPRIFARVHTRFLTPHIAVAFYSFLGFLLAAFGAFKQLAILSSAATLMIYLGVVLATIKLRNTNTGGERTFLIPGGLTVPLLAVGVILWLLSKMTRQEMFGMAGFIAILTFIYLINNLIRKKRISNGRQPGP